MYRALVFITLKFKESSWSGPSVVAVLVLRLVQLIEAKGPHGFSLHFHAQVGGDHSKTTLEYLQSIKPIELKPVPFLQKKDKPTDEK